VELPTYYNKKQNRRCVDNSGASGKSQHGLCEGSPASQAAERPEITPTELARLSTSCWPPRSSAVLRETEQPGDKEGLHMDWEKKDNKTGQKYRSKRTIFTVNCGVHSDRELRRFPG